MGRKTKKEIELKNTKNMQVALASFEVETSGEKIIIIRIADHFAWRWDYQGKSYGDWVIQPPFKEKNSEKRIKELTEQVDAAKGGKKIKLTKQLMDAIKFYEDLKTEDVSNLLSVLTQQADETIDKIKNNNQ